MILAILRLTFDGLALLAVSGVAEAADPPTRNAPPSITYAVSGDSCDLQMR